MGTNKLLFVGIDGDRTIAHDRKSRAGSDVSHVTGSGPDRKWPWPEVTLVTCHVRKYGVRMRNRKLRIIRPIRAFWPEVTSSNVTWPLWVPLGARMRNQKFTGYTVCTTFLSLFLH